MKMSNPKGIEKLKELEIKLEKTELTREVRKNYSSYK